MSDEGGEPVRVLRARVPAWGPPPWWFGSGSRSIGTQVAVPLGLDCVTCGEVVEEGDSGQMVPLAAPLPDSDGMRPWGAEHGECVVLRSFGHLMGECACRFPERSLRDCGRATLARMAERMDDFRVTPPEDGGES